MANWLLVIDPDEDRRIDYVSGINDRLAPVEGLDVSSLVGDGWSVMWAAAMNAPVSVDTDEVEYGAFVWGEPRNSDGKQRSAAEVRGRWRDGAVAQWDGYYSAAVVEASGRSLTVGADLLGIFPVCYWSDDDGVILAGTSPELFQAHPAFHPSLNIEGLVGILLTNGLVNGQTLWRGVKRLHPGNRIRVDGTRVYEDQAYEIPSEMRDCDLPLSCHADLLFDTLQSAARRHAPADREYGLLLSGGLDSRMVAGFLIRAGITPNALTLGLPSDLEMRCSKAVAKRYMLKHTTGEPSATDYPKLATLHARWEHLACGFTTIRDWWTQERVGQLGSHLVTGGLADSLVGGTSLSWAYSDDPPGMSYDAFMTQMPKLGIAPDVIRKLLRDPQADQAVAHVENNLREEFEGYSDRLSYCAWRYDLLHGQRYHVGGTAWRLSFGAWPVLPMLDRAVVSVVSSLPAASLADRAVQLALVERNMPELGDVPMDRSDLALDEAQYLHPEPRQLLADAIRRQVRHARNILTLGHSSEARYWHRVNNLNGALWKRAREGAEQNRSLAEDIFDPEFLRIILPPPGIKTAQEGPFVGESGRKMILGFMYWAEGRIG